MRAPLRFCRGNLLWDGAGGVWSLYRLAGRSYADQPRPERLALFGELAALVRGLERDLQLLRVSRHFTPEAYAAQAEATLDPLQADRERFAAYLAPHRRLLAEHRAARPEVFLSVRLEGRPSPLARARELLGLSGGQEPRSPVLRDPRGIGSRALGRLRTLEAEVAEEVEGWADAERATSEDVAWLVARAYARGVTEPLRPSDWRPQALVLHDEADEARLVPLEHDVLRLFAAPIAVGPRSLRIEGEGAESHQALLAVGALPEEVPFPDPRAELLFAPLESLGFPVDACLSIRPVPNPDARALVRRRIVDADVIHAEESRGDHGPSAGADERPLAARELEAYLGDPSRPPLLRAAISLAVGAPDAQELERRVAALRRAYGGVELHRPLGSQLPLFLSHLPAQGSPLPEYEDILLVEQVAAMVPTATHEVGTECGPYIGHTLSGSAQPVLLDLSAASGAARPPSALLLGAPGGGKTVLLELLVYQSWLAGSLVVDIDPKGDHRLEALPGLGAELEVIELSGAEAQRGLLDPLRTSPPGTAADAGVAFLTDVLPPPVPPEWRTEIRRAVSLALEAEDPTCSRVLELLLASGEEPARAAGRALSVYAESGLAGLGFARPGEGAPAGVRAPVTQIRVRGLPRPLPGTPRAELSEDERIGQAVLRLLAGYAMALLGAERSRHKVIAIDEAFFLLADAAGQRLVAHLNRWGRSEFATPLLVTHLVDDAGEMDNLIGARFVFGMESEREAARALSLLHLDPEDAELRRRLVAHRQGACMLRDWEGRVGAMRVEIPDPGLLAALDTTPRRDG